jgi:thermostable 8-oxoguanine DNA glycosylase
MIKASDFDGDLGSFMEKYEYHRKLTDRLDQAKDDFTQERINEIVLWKVNRFAELDVDLISKINSLSELQEGQQEQARSSLEGLLKTPGVDLAMASTILRFRNPAVFQIIDRHAYRALYGRPLPMTIVSGKKIELYFQYLEDLRSLCDERGLRFETADRVLYVFDKTKNGSLMAR